MASKEIKRWQDHQDHETVGRWFKAWDGRIYFCNYHNPADGFCMTAVMEPDGTLSDEPHPDQFGAVGRSRVTVISERAIGRTFHRIYEDGTARARH